MKNERDKARKHDPVAGESSPNLKRFEKQLANLRRFHGTENDASPLIRHRINNRRIEKVFYVESDEELFDNENYVENWKKAREIPIGRREWPGATSIFILHLYVDEYSICYKNNERVTIPDIDILFGDDPDCRSMGNYLETDKSGQRPRRKVRRLEFLRFVELVSRTYHLIRSD